MAFTGLILVSLPFGALWGDLGQVVWNSRVGGITPMEALINHLHGNHT